MRCRVFVILGLSGILMLGACSSSTEEKPKAQANSMATANGPNAAQDPNTATVTNGMVVTPQSVDANSVSATSSDTATGPNIPPQLKAKMEQMKSGGETVDAAALAMKNARPAPDNSTFTSYLTDAGYEIRTFKNHPQLLKAEKRIDNNGDQSLKIFLRNGKVVEVPGQRVPILSTAPAASIADVAGIVASPQKQANPGSTGAKTTVN